MSNTTAPFGRIRTSIAGTLLAALGLVAILICATLATSGSVQAQFMDDSIPSLPSDLGPLIQQQLDRSQDGFGTEGVTPRTTTLFPEVRDPESLELTEIEARFSRRAGRPLRLIGRRAFGTPEQVTLRQTGAIQESYVLGVGDEIVLVLRGPDGGTFRTRVNRDGNVIFRDLPPVPAAGLRFGEFREALEEQVRAVYIESDVFVTLGEVRQISVMINGEVRSPGVVQLNGLASIVDVIHLAGGIGPGGSFRNIQILRGDRTIQIDLYDFILGRRSVTDFGIAQGDQIFVPVLGSTVAVAGQVKRAGIFELPAGDSAITAQELLELGGGTTGRGPYAVNLLRILPDGREDLIELGSAGDQRIRDGEILIMEPETEASIGRVELLGHVKLPRSYPLESARSVGRIISGEGDLERNPYLPFAVVQTTNPRTLTKDFDAFDLGAVLRGRTDVPLEDGDKVYVFGMDEISFLTSAGVGRALRGISPEEDVECEGLRFLARWVRSNSNSELASGQFAEAFTDLVSGEKECPRLFEEVPDLLTYLLQNSVLLRGNLLRPGAYPIVDQSQMRQVLSMAGGAPDRRRVDVVSAPAMSAGVSGARPDVAAGGILEVVEPRVTLTGHVRFPGTRSLGSTPMLSQLIGDIDIYKDNPYLLFGIISRVDPATFSRQFEYFNPSRIISGETDVELRDRDIVRILGFNEVTFLLNSEPFGGVSQGPGMRGQGDRQQNGLRPSGAQGTSVFDYGPRPQDASYFDPTRQNQFYGQGRPGGSAMMGPGAMPGRPGSNFGPGIGPGFRSDFGFGGQLPFPGYDGRPITFDDSGILTQEGFQRMLLNSSVALVGEVMLPGRYPVTETVTVRDVIDAAGGLTRLADTSAVELTRFLDKRDDNQIGAERTMLDLDIQAAANALVSPGNVVRVNPVMLAREEGFIEIEGQVQRPGRYDIIAGERLSSVLRRAGGLKDSAYPYGAVYTRESVREKELQARERAIAELNRALASALTRPDSREQPGLDPESATVIQSLIDDLESAELVGRVVVETDPNVLRAHPERDILVEPGDKLIIPRRPWFVFVSGEVFNPGAQRFVRGRDVYEYIDAAGGVTADAETSNIFLVSPDGSARQISSSSWSSGMGPEAIAPGSAIIVPRDLRPFDLMQFTTNIADIVSRLAISAASISVISNN